MAGQFVFMTRSEGKRLLRAENPYMFEQATRRSVIRAGTGEVEKITFVPEKHQENYMATTGAKLYFWDKVAMLSGYSSNGSDVTDLIKKYKLQTYATEDEVFGASPTLKAAA